MIVTGASVEDVELIVRAVSATKYNGNVEIRDISDKSGPRTVRTSFTLRVRDGHAGSPGAKGSRGFDSSGTGPHGLRCSPLSACWHVHYDVLETLFTHHPAVIVTTSMARYVAEDFHRRAIETAALNVGSQMQPLYSTDLCECEHPTDDEMQQAILDNHPARDLGTSQHYAPAGNFSRETYPREADLGKYASGGAYGAEMTTAMIRGEYCEDCGCTS